MRALVVFGGESRPSEIRILNRAFAEWFFKKTKCHELNEATYSKKLQNSRKDKKSIKSQKNQKNSQNFRKTKKKTIQCFKYQCFVQAFQGPKCDGALDHFHHSRFEDFKSFLRRIISLSIQINIMRRWDPWLCIKTFEYISWGSDSFTTPSRPILCMDTTSKFANDMFRQQMTATPILGDATRMTNEQFSIERSTEGRCKSKYGKSTNYKTASITTISL